MKNTKKTEAKNTASETVTIPAAQYKAMTEALSDARQKFGFLKESFGAIYENDEFKFEDPIRFAAGARNICNDAMEAILKVQPF
jgi:hypothetical protein